MADSTQPPQLNFPLLQLINDARSTYGLRHQDFGRYKSHCTAKVAHLRKAVGLTQVSGKAKKFHKKDLSTPNITSDKHLQILLFDSERAWAYSQLLKASLSLPSTTPETKHHLSKRLSRAAQHAHQLHLLLSSPTLSSRLSASHRAQATAYYLVMKGSLAFEQQKHQEGVAALSVAYSLLGTLASNAGTAHDEALANEMIDEVEPMLRFCAYSLQLDVSNGVGLLARETTGREKERLVAGFDALVAEVESSGGKGRRETVELVWRGREIPIRNAQLVQVVLKVKDALASLEADKPGVEEEPVERKKSSKKGGRKEVMGVRRMGTYDKALQVLGEAEDVARQLVEDNKIALSRAHSARFEASSTPLQLAHSYIVYQLLSIRISRDLLLVSDSRAKLAAREEKILATEAAYVVETGRKDPEMAAAKRRKQQARVYPGVVKLLEGVVMSLEQMRDLEIVEQDGELAATVEARIAFVRASRCLFLSRTYALVDKIPFALSLNARAKLYSRESRAAASIIDGDETDETDGLASHLLPLTAADFDRLDRELAADYERASKDWYAATGGKVVDDDEIEPDELAVADLSLVGTPRAGAGAKAKAKERKPAFYDVAFNYAAAFDLEAIAERAGLRGPLVGEAAGTKVVERAEDAEMESKVEVVEKAPAKGWGFGLFGKK